MHVDEEVRVAGNKILFLGLTEARESPVFSGVEVETQRSSKAVCNHYRNIVIFLFICKSHKSREFLSDHSPPPQFTIYIYIYIVLVSICGVCVFLNDAL